MSLLEHQLFVERESSGLTLTHAIIDRIIHNYLGQLSHEELLAHIENRVR